METFALYYSRFRTTWEVEFVPRSEDGKMRLPVDFVPNMEAHSQVCQVQLQPVGVHGQITVVIVSNIPGKPGGVTNDAEYIATRLVHVRNLNPGRLLWLEHYPDRNDPARPPDPGRAETYDLVTFTWTQDEAGHWVATEPDWLVRVSPQFVAELLQAPCGAQSGPHRADAGAPAPARSHTGQEKRAAVAALLDQPGGEPATAQEEE